MTTTKENDRLGVTADYGFSTGWDWKGEYVGSLGSGSDKDGYERFSQHSATPDTTLMFGGPARYTGLSDSTADLVPIGLTDGIQYNANAQLARLYEIGSNRAFFTRGKTMSGISFGRMLADQSSILNVLSKNAYKPMMNNDGMKAAGADSPNPDIFMNLDSETLAVPFGLLLVFKTRGGGDGGYGKTLTAVYLEYCMFEGYNFTVNAQSPVIVEGISIQYDRAVPVSIS